MDSDQLQWIEKFRIDCDQYVLVLEAEKIAGKQVKHCYDRLAAAVHPA